MAAARKRRSSEVHITEEFSLKPRQFEGRWYVVWSALALYGATRQLYARWLRFAEKSAAGKTYVGRYYSSRTHAARTIADFKAKEAARKMAKPTT